MSHISRIEMEIRNLQDFGVACNNLGVSLDLNVDHYVTEEFGRRSCDHRISMAGVADQAGLVKQGDAYALQLVPYGRLAATLGYSGNKIKQEYSAVLQTRELQKKGFRVQRTVQNGKIRLEAVRNA